MLKKLVSICLFIAFNSLNANSVTLQYDGSDLNENTITSYGKTNSYSDINNAYSILMGPSFSGHHFNPVVILLDLQGYSFESLTQLYLQGDIDYTPSFLNNGSYIKTDGGSMTVKIFETDFTNTYAVYDAYNKGEISEIDEIVIDDVNDFNDGTYINLDTTEISANYVALFLYGTFNNSKAVLDVIKTNEVLNFSTKLTGNTSIPEPANFVSFFGVISLILIFIKKRK